LGNISIRSTALYNYNYTSLVLDKPESIYDIIIEFNGRDFNQNSFGIVHQLSDIITESGEVGTFELDVFKITINKIESFSKDLIFISK
jgi:hypothetical protein